MAFSFPLILFFLLLFTGCSTDNLTAKEYANKKNPTDNTHKTAKSELQKFKNKTQKKNTQIPSLILPPVYETISVFDNRHITFSANNADLHSVLYSISNISGVNLIIDNDVKSNIPITLSVKDADLKSVLDLVMNMSGCYYTLTGNILHIKQFQRKRFFIPYVHTTTSFETQLGGDTLGSATSGSSSGGGDSSNAIKGEFKLHFDNAKDSNDFYKEIEKNLKSIISSEGSYTLNHFTGILSVYDRKKNVDAIENMIKAIKKQSSKAVLIETKILEITLNKGHQLGVDWQNIGTVSGGKLKLAQTLALTGDTAGSVVFTSDNGDFTGVINALDSSGKIDTLSNPRIKVLSGQSAIISSGKLVPFWEKEVQTNQGTGGSASTIEVTYNRRDVLHGITMGVTPTILEDGNIMLNVIPISSSIETVVKHHDESGAIVASAPILNIKETGTIINAHDNDLVLIGGLISNETIKDKKSIPLLGDIPYLGALFSQVDDKIVKKELVILIKLKAIE